MIYGAYTCFREHVFYLEVPSSWKAEPLFAASESLGFLPVQLKSHP